jgi:hypothetical protein
MTKAITTQEVQQAARELARMRSSLAAWLRYRNMNDQVLAGTAQTRKPLAYAQRAVANSRDMAAEQDLATNLTALLEAVMPGAQLPNPNVLQNPDAAVQLAQLALTGGASVSSPTATGSLGLASHPLMWPALIVLGVVVVATSAISTYADVAKDREEKACIEAGACTDYGFWLKAAGAAVLAYFVWEKMGVKEFVAKKART